MIYSCTMFFNEFRLLDVKIDEEYDFVDKIIIVEANQTFRGNPKPFYLKDRYKNDPKIQVILLGNEFELPNPHDSFDEIKRKAFANEGLQRSSGLRGQEIKEDDIIIGADVDEIIIRDEIERMIEEIKIASTEPWGPNNFISGRHVSFKHRYHPYKLNYEIKEHQQLHSFGITGDFYLNFGKKFNLSIALDGVRRSPYGKQINTNNHHFSFIDGDPIYKIRNFSDIEYDNSEIINSFKEKVANGIDPLERNLEIVEIDETYPKSIRKNLEYWKDVIR